MSGSGSGSGRVPARPRQVTLAGSLATVACALLVLTLFQAMTQVRSAQTQASVRTFLSTAPGSSLGLGVDGALGIMRGVVLLSGALAAAGTILAVYTLRRHRGARVGLSLVAVLMLFVTTFVAGLLPFAVALSASMLWRREARDWFDGREPAPRPSRPVTRSVPDPPSPSATAVVPREVRATWQPPQLEQPPQLAQPTAAAPRGASAVPALPGQRLRRPASVTTAVWVTWVFAGVTVLLAALMALTMAVQRRELATAMQHNPRLAAQSLTGGQLLGVLWLLVVVVAVWSLVAIALAVLAFRGARAGRVGLLVSAALTGLVGAISLVGALHAIAAILTVVLLLRGDAKRFFD